MHDIFEGVCQYDIGKILNVYIFEKKFFTLDLLNNRIRGFYYGPIEKRNHPPEIQLSHVKNQCINMSSFEMHCFILNIHLLIGDLVPESDEHCLLLIKLKKIIDIVTSNILHDGIIIYFKVPVHEYLSLLLKLFPNCLKFKHHILTHYYRVLKLFGPLMSISCSSGERKHRESKIAAHTSISRVNIGHTLAIKSQLKFNSLLRRTDAIFLKQAHHDLYT